MTDFDPYTLAMGMPGSMSPNATVKLNRIIQDLDDMECIFVVMKLPSIVWDTFSGTISEVTQMLREYIKQKRSTGTNITERVFIGGIEEKGESTIEVKARWLLMQPNRETKAFPFSPPEGIQIAPQEKMS